MSREDKQKTIKEIEEIITDSSVAVFTDYRGLTAAEMTGLRCKLRSGKVGYRVVKNTLARFAAEGTKRQDLLEIIDGPVAIAYGSGEVTEPAKLLLDYINANKLEVGIKGGFIGDRMLTEKEVSALAKMPSREVLLAKLLGGMNSPIVNLVTYLNAPARGLAGVLQARIKQLEGVS